MTSQLAPRRQRDAPALGGHAGPESPQHPLGVIARRHRLLHAHLPIREQPRQEDRRLHLGRRHRRPVAQRLQRPGPADRERQAASVAPADDCRAHLGQRLGHPPHGTAPEGIVASQDAPERLPRENAQEEPRRGARVAAVENVVRLLKTLEPGALDPVFARPLPRHLHPQRPERAERVEAVLALQEAADLRRARRQRPEEPCPVRHGFVSRNPDRPGEPSGWTPDQDSHSRRFLNCRISSSFRSRRSPSSSATSRSSSSRDVLKAARASRRAARLD